MRLVVLLLLLFAVAGHQQAAAGVHQVGLGLTDVRNSDVTPQHDVTRDSNDNLECSS